MKYKKVLLVVAAAAVIGVSAVAEAKNVRVGVVLPYTGGAAQFGQQIDRGMSPVSYTHLTLPTTPYV